MWPYGAIAKMMRQTGKQILTILRCAAVAACLAPLAVVPASALTSSFSQTIVTDPLTGVAIDGFDPVSYFTGDVPQRGKPDFEYVWRGVSWYFASAANRDVFINHPEIYAPRFGGHGAMSLARGFLSDGNPHVFLVFRNRLYLFYSAGNRDAFMMSGNPIIGQAERSWKRLSGAVARN